MGMGEATLRKQHLHCILEDRKEAAVDKAQGESIPDRQYPECRGLEAGRTLAHFKDSQGQWDRENREWEETAQGWDSLHSSGSVH